MQKAYGIGCYLIAMRFKVIQTPILVEEWGFLTGITNFSSKLDFSVNLTNPNVLRSLSPHFQRNQI